MTSTDRVIAGSGSRREITDRVGATVILGGPAFPAVFICASTAGVIMAGASEARSVFSMGAGALLIMKASYILADFFFTAQASFTAGGKSTATSLFDIDGAGLFNFISYEIPDMKNVIINGGMGIAQRDTSFAAVSNGTFTLDRWEYLKSGAMVHTASQDTTDVPTVAQAGTLLLASLRLNLTTADTSIAAGEYVHMRQDIEGHNFRAIAQQSFTLTFWVKATLTGIYCVAFRNSVPDRSYVAEYTISVANTWEKKTIVVSASPSAGTWDYTTGLGLSVGFTLAAGATYQTTANAWNVGNFLATANQVNGVNTGSTDFRLAAVQIEAGTLATSFEQRSYGLELALCQRYYERMAGAIGSTYPNAGVVSNRIRNTGASTTDIFVFQPFMAVKRASPTISLRYDVNDGAHTDGSAANTNQGGFFIDVNVPAGEFLDLNDWQASAEI